jgi:hypothetical protein
MDVILAMIAAYIVTAAILFGVKYGKKKEK